MDQFGIIIQVLDFDKDESIINEFWKTNRKKMNTGYNFNYPLVRQQWFSVGISPLSPG